MFISNDVFLVMDISRYFWDWLSPSFPIDSSLCIIYNVSFNNIKIKVNEARPAFGLAQIGLR